MQLTKLSVAAVGAGCILLAAAAPGRSAGITLEYDRTIGAPGFGPGQLFVPQGIGVQDKTGDVFISNGRGLNPDGSFNPNLGNRVEVFSSEGKYLRSIGTGSQKPGDGFDEPADLKFHPQTGELHVGDVFNSEIDVYNPDTGKFIRSYGKFGGPVEGRLFFGPGGLSFDEYGDLYATDFSTDVIKKYDGGSGELIDTIGSAGSKLGQFSGPAGITVSPNTGKIYVNDQYNNRIQVLNPKGETLYAFGEEGTKPGQFNEPIGLEVDEFENLYVADSQNSRVQVFDKDGKLLDVFGGPAKTPDGKVVPPPALGSPPFGDPLDLEPGKFNWSAGLHYDDKKLYVGDFFQGRVQVTKAVPEPSTVAGVIVAGAGAAATWRKRRRQKLVTGLTSEPKKTAA